MWLLVAVAVAMLPLVWSLAPHRLRPDELIAAERVA